MVDSSWPKCTFYHENQQFGLTPTRRFAPASPQGGGGSLWIQCCLLRWLEQAKSLVCTCSPLEGPADSHKIGTSAKSTIYRVHVPTSPLWGGRSRRLRVGVRSRNNRVTNSSWPECTFYQKNQQLGLTPTRRFAPASPQGGGGNLWPQCRLLARLERGKITRVHILDLEWKKKGGGAAGKPSKLPKILDATHV